MSKLSLTQYKYACFIALLLSFFVMPVATQAFYADTETSTRQQFQASELQLETTLTQSAVAIGIDQAGASTSLMINTSAQSVPAVFDVTTVGVAGDVAFCDNLQLQATNGPVTAQAILPAFTTLEQATFGEYELAVSFVDGGLVTAGQECVVTLAVTAWQQNMSKATGYQDIALYDLTITATELSVQRQAAPLLLGDDIEDNSTNTAPTKVEPASVSTESDSGGNNDGSADSVPTPNVAGASDESAESVTAEGSETTSPAPKDPATEAKKQPEPPSEPVTEPEEEANKPTESSAPVTPDEDPAADDTPVKQEGPPAPEDEAEPGSTEVANEEINQPLETDPESEPAVTKPEPEPVEPPETSTDDAASESVTEPEPAVVKEEVANESS